MSFKSTLFLATTFFSLTLFAQTPALSKTWVADNGDGTYKNPVLHADYSDPDAIRVGNDYYLTASSFNASPGLPILHSKDLVNWSVINYALPRLTPEDVFNIPQHGKGVWAPSMNYHNNEFYIYYPDPDYGIYMIKTKDPAKKWSNPVLVLAGKGIIDPTSYWDNDGRVYLAVAWAGSRAGVNSLITIFQMNSRGDSVTDHGKHVYDGHGIDPTIEGPKFLKRNGFYYLLAPAGGVSTGWQLALRSKNIYGPYERKVVMDQGNTVINGPHQGAMVTTVTGESWFLHFQDKEAYGRVMHLQPVSWKDNWPVIGKDDDGDGKGEPVSRYRKPNAGKVYPLNTPTESDEFDNDAVGLQWQWQANEKIQWSALIPSSGFLRLFASTTDAADNLWNAPNLLLQKFPAPDFIVTTKIKWNAGLNNFTGKHAGLVIMGEDYAYLSIAKDEKGYKIQQAVCTNASLNTPERIIQTKNILDSTVYFRVQVRAPNATCNFSYSIDGNLFIPIGEPFNAKPGRWVGAKVGLFCVASTGSKTGGYADVDWFRVEKQ